MTGMGGNSGWVALIPMAAMGLLVSVVAPALILASARYLRTGPGGRAVVRALTWPAPAALIGFVLLHGVITVGLDVHPIRLGLSVLVHLVLLAGAIVFWLPVLSGPRRLDPGARTVYLLLGAPALDLAGVIIVARGDTGGGLAMIAAMLPIGIAAVVLAWQWISGEEAAVRAVEATAGRPDTPPPTVLSAPGSR